MGSHEIAVNGRCRDALPLTPGAPAVSGDTAGGWQYPCPGDGTIIEAALYYRVTVAAETAVIVRANQPSGSRESVSVRLLESCAAACLPLAEIYTDDSVSVIAGNPSTAPRDVIVAVGRNYLAREEARFAVTASARAQGTICALPIPLTPERPAMGVQSRDGGNEEPLRCQPLAEGPRTFFGLRVPPRTRATVRAVPANPTTARWAPTLRLLDTCRALTCLASQLGGTSGSTTELVFTHEGTAARDFIVTVAGWMRPRETVAGSWAQAPLGAWAVLGAHGAPGAPATTAAPSVGVVATLGSPSDDAGAQSVARRAVGISRAPRRTRRFQASCR